MREYYCDYDYLAYFFEDKQLLSEFMLKFDGFTFKVKLDEHKRSCAQKRLLDGESTASIANDLEMKVKTVGQIRRRMIKNNLVMHAISNDIDHSKKDKM